MLNVLEFLTRVITVELALVNLSADSKFPCVEALPDSTAAISWTEKFKFLEAKQIIYMILSCYLSDLLIHHNACFDAWYIPVLNNTIVESLTRYFHLTSGQLALIFFSVYATNNWIPSSWKIFRMLTSQSLLLNLLLLRLTSPRVLSPMQNPSALAGGTSGRFICAQLAAQTLAYK